MALFKKITAYILGILALGFVILVIVRAFHFYNLDKTNAQIEIIHNTKLRMVDVMGENLPPDPGVAADATIAGVDANHNGIRDDVELAVFKEYPKSAKTRAVLLQYALVLQMEVSYRKANKDIVTAVAEKTSAGYYCVGEITSRSNMSRFIDISNRLHNFLEGKQLNNNDRIEYHKNFYDDKLNSYELSTDCDIDYSTLPN